MTPLLRLDITSAGLRVTLPSGLEIVRPMTAEEMRALGEQFVRAADERDAIGGVGVWTPRLSPEVYRALLEPTRKTTDGKA